MVIGVALRRNNKKILTKTLKYLFDKEKYYDVMPPRRLDKIIDITDKVGQFVLGIAFFIALSTVFLGILYPRMGFEKLIILMGTIVIFLVRKGMETFNNNQK